MNLTINTLTQHRTYRHFKTDHHLSSEQLNAIIDCDPCCQFRTVKLGRF